ncbi:FMN-binding protein MioC [Vibrio ulleungensis]|jgi:MioC protein|uniref:FMN-binding protein MioC n=1 Tax=Vibrio ulleungensis TaxID=2807619 RepID=A0ABS2HN64_9VIBR|nr:FMN-binding protein MioC [Vibrio ulleungensis]MBM7038516.1 FMN-binding protein MioC [Vibrio ulleungensis]
MTEIIIGSTLGGTEYVAEHLADLLTEKGITSTLHTEPDLNAIPASGTWVIVTSTHGAGDYPDNIQPFIRALQDTPPRMSEVRYITIAVGDSSYDTFCAAGKHAHHLLEDIGGTALSELVCIDVQQYPVPEDAVSEWFESHADLF